MKQITLPKIFQNHMILQRNKPIRIWGECEKDCMLRIVLGTNDSILQAEGETFFCEMDPMDAARDLSLSIYLNEQAKPALTLTDISIGDVYLAGGQSNMEFYLRYEAHWSDTRRKAVNPDIHMYNCDRIAFDGQKRPYQGTGYWFTKEDRAFPFFSAPGYYFASEIQELTGIPIGIIGCNWGGTPACAWMSKTALEENGLSVFLDEYEIETAKLTDSKMEKESKRAWDHEDSFAHDLDFRPVLYGLSLEEQKKWMELHAGDPVLPMGPFHHYRPCGLYEHMLKKIAPLSLCGVLWYQGESDSGHSQIYDRTFSALISCWRETLKDPGLPFFYVQLAPFMKWLECTGENYEIVREKQEWVCNNMKDTHMASIMDLGMYEDIHPKEKKEVGHRLALLAEHYIYQMPVLCEAPSPVQFHLDENTVDITFDHVGTSLYVKGEEIQALLLFSGETSCPVTGFSIDGPTLHVNFEPINNGPILLKFAEVPYCEVNLFNESGLPAKPFTHKF